MNNVEDDENQREE